MNKEKTLQLAGELMAANFETIVIEMDLDYTWVLGIAKEDFYNDRLKWVNKFAKKHNLGYVISNNFLKFIEYDESTIEAKEANKQ